MKKLLAIALAASAMIAAAAIPNSGDTVVIDDFKFVIVSEQDYADLTNKVNLCVQTWEKLHSTESGRVALHGRRGHSSVTNGEMSVTYADGYTRTEKISRSRPAKTTAKKSAVYSKPFGITKAPLPEAVTRMRAKREAAKKAKTVTVTKEVGK